MSSLHVLAVRTLAPGFGGCCSTPALSNPDCRAEYPIDGGSDSLYFEWFAESLRSILPRVVALGIVSEDEIDIDTLEGHARREIARRKCSARELSPCTDDDRGFRQAEGLKLDSLRRRPADWRNSTLAATGCCLPRDGRIFKLTDCRRYTHRSKALIRIGA